MKSHLCFYTSGLALVLLSVHLLGFCTFIQAENVAFPSGNVFETVVESPGTEFDDPLETGSVLLKSDNDQRRLTYHIKVGEWRSKTSEYYRAHPLFLDVLQKAFSAVYITKAQVRVRSAYKGESEVPHGSSKWADRYARTGAGAEVIFTPAPGSTLEEALETFLKTIIKEGMLRFSAMGRDLGFVLMKDSLFVFLTGDKEVSRPVCEVDGSPLFENSLSFTKELFELMNEQMEFTDVRTLYQCQNIPPLSVGQFYGNNPAAQLNNSNPIDVTVGPLDVPISRQDGKDFLRLIQYPGVNMAFSAGAYDDGEKPAWCGRPGTPCLDVAPCRNGFVGNGASVRCAVRTMAPRLLRRLLTLEHLVRHSADTMNSKLQVLLAWTEPNAKDPLGGAERPNSLHFEGRQAVISLEKGYSEASMAALTRLAICAGLDYVYHGGANVTVAVLKQADFDTQPVAFTTRSQDQVALVPVAVPERVESDYRMPSAFTDDEMSLYPLFDSKVAAKQILFDTVTAADFRSKEEDFRYFRLSRVIVQCYEALWHHWQQMTQLWYGDQHGAIPKLEIVRAFMSSAEERSLFEPVLDHRLYTHSLGIALHLRFKPSTGQQYQSFANTWSLLEAAAEVCSPIIYRETQQFINFGVYRDGLFITYQPTFQMWFECTECPELLPPHDLSQDQLTHDIRELVTLSMNGRLIRAEDPSQACQQDYPPKPQSENYHHIPDPMIFSNESCSETNTPFCVHTAQHRKQAVEEVWSYFQRKTYAISPEALKKALEGCLLSCSPCTRGPLWLEKVKHCDNLLHWMPFHTLNGVEYPVTTNIFPRGDEAAREFACYGGDRHCIDASPMLAILYDVIDRTIRWEDKKALTEKLYNPTENPLPIIQLAGPIYALAAHGEVNVWIRQSEDIDTMRESLKTLFVYNHNITMVHIYLLDPTTRISSVTVLETYLGEWASNGCPKNARKTLTPYKLHEDPKQFHAPLEHDSFPLRTVASLERPLGRAGDFNALPQAESQETSLPPSQYRRVVLDHLRDWENNGLEGDSML